MTVQIHSRFQTCVKCVHLKVFLLVGAWRGRALFTFVYHCNVIPRAKRRTLWGRQHWLEAGDTDLTTDNSASNITWFDCHDLNDRGRMEIDHVFSSGAVAGLATMHSTGDPTRVWWSVQPRLLTQKCGWFLQYYILCHNFEHPMTAQHLWPMQNHDLISWPLSHQTATYYYNICIISS